MKTFMSLLATIALVQGEAIFEMNEEKQELTIPESFPVDQLNDLSQLESLPKSIIIIGAGASGINTAHTLIQKGYKNSIKIVEAFDQFGGRMRTTEFAGRTVELGANWVSGTTQKVKGVTKTNPLWKLAEQCSLKGYPEEDKNNQWLVHDDKGNDITRKYNKRDDIFADAWEEA
jgi:hypothetical protein